MYCGSVPDFNGTSYFGLYFIFIGVSMSNYIPDGWVVIKIPNNEGFVYKVFASWYGGYARGDSWKVNSGITSVTQEGMVYSFSGYSGSVYECHKDSYGLNFYGSSVLEDMIARAAEQGVEIEILPQETNFIEIDYGRH
jgi:ribosomal protein L21E